MSVIFKRLSVPAVLALILMFCVAPGVHAELKNQNIVQLIESSQSIIAGTVTEVSDGIDSNGVPYTEVTIQVGISPKGTIKAGEYTFRQFGLQKPRTLANGHRLLAVTPADFPEWRENEYVLAFLYHPAAKTGLQTTVGLAQGKFTKVNETFSNRFGNVGLFANVKANPGVLSRGETSLLQSTGPVNTTSLLDLISHVVKDQLIQKGAIKP